MRGRFTGPTARLTFAVVALGAVLRLVLFDLMEFKFDEVEVLRLTRHWLETGWPQYGMMSGVGIRNPPGFVLVLAPIVAITSAPLAAGLWVAAFGIAAIAVLARVGAAIGSARAGLWAGLLMATHPWLVLYSRKIWAQSLLGFFVALLLFVVFHCMRSPKSRAAFWVAPLACATWQIHYSAYAVVAFVLVWSANEIRLRRMHLPMASAGACAALLLLAPYLRYLAANDFADVRVSLGVGAEDPGAERTWSMPAVWAATAFAGGLGSPFRFDLAPLSAALPGARGSALGLAAVGATALVLVCAACAWLRWSGAPSTERPIHGARGWLTFFVLLPPAMYWARGIETPPHYFIVSLPPLLLLAGLGLDELARRFGRHPWLGVLPGASIATCGTIATLSILFAIDADGGTAGDWGASYRAQRAVARVLVDEGVDPDQVDARGTRDQSIGVYYLVLRMLERERRPVLGRGAILVDRLLTPERGPPPAVSLVRSERFGPLQVCVVGERDGS